MLPMWQPDWKSLAAELNCTANAAHLRYFRMKTQLEKGERSSHGGFWTNG